jgi:N-carbamoyl-L-amino-acid hydrolase
MTITVDSERLLTELTKLASFSEPAAEGAVHPGDTAVTRVVFTERDHEARAYLAALAQAAGLSIRTDAVGNTFYCWKGSEPELPAVATGSHVDAIPNAGMYDGTVGVLGGLEAIRALQAAGFQPKRSIELILFTSEEPTRFGIGCLGSRLMSGTLTVEIAAQLRDKQDRSLDEVRSAAGFTGPLASTRLVPGQYEAFVELHIEQGPILEAEQIPIGIVTAIAAPAAATITITGLGGHAGAMLMPVRKDALAAASEVILAVETAALATVAIDSVATVGVCDVFPGAVNSVPSRVRLSLDARDIDLARRDAMLAQIETSCHEIAARRKLAIAFEMLNADAPATCDARVLEAIGQACAETGTPSRKMISRAYHDSLFMARLCPIAMIFIPCRGGVSHRPDEFSSPEDIANGTSVLAHTLAALSRR